MSPKKRLGLFTVAVALAGLSAGCGQRKKEGETSAVPAASAAPSAPKADAAKAPPSDRPKGKSVLLDPPLQVIPGAGLSPIRFGATFATVERHIGAPCDYRTETRCVYVDRALDFSFEGGLLTKIRVERRDRVVPGVPGTPRYYGLFNGGMRPSLMIGLHRHIVAEEFKEKPLKTEPLSGPDGQFEKQVFPGVTLEFDTLSNGNVVLAGFELVKDEEAAKRALADLAQAATK